MKKWKMKKGKRKFKKNTHIIGEITKKTATTTNCSHI